MTHDDNTRVLRRAVLAPTASTPTSESASGQDAASASATAFPFPFPPPSTSTSDTANSLTLSTPSNSDTDNPTSDTNKDSSSSSSVLALALAASAKTLNLGLEAEDLGPLSLSTTFDSFFGLSTSASAQLKKLNDNSPRLATLLEIGRSRGGAIHLDSIDSLGVGGGFDVDDIIMDPSLDRDRDRNADTGAYFLLTPLQFIVFEELFLMIPFLALI